MTIQNPPKELSMVDFKAVNDSYGGLAKSCRFAARIRPSGTYLANRGSIMSDLTYLCEVGEMPGRSLTSMDVRYYGPNHKLPFLTQYDDLNLGFLTRVESPERKFFDDWISIINPINLWDFNYRDDYSAMIDIYQFAETPNEDGTGPKATYCITCHNAYPIVVNPQPMTWADDQFQRLVVNFTYTHWSRIFTDAEPKIQTSTGHSFELVAGREGNETRLPIRTYY